MTSTVEDVAALDAQLPLPDVETEFMQNFRVASAVSAGATVQAIRNGSGDVELFTLDPGGAIWNFYPDPTSQSGYRGVSTGVTASTFGVGREPDGRIVLFAASGLRFSRVVETPQAATRWSNVQVYVYPKPSGAQRIARILVKDIDGGPYVGVLVEVKSAGHTLYTLVYSIWREPHPVFEHPGMNVSSTHCVWLGNTAATAAFACVDVVVVAYAIASRAVTRYPMKKTFKTLSVAAAEDAAGKSELVAVLDDGIVYRLAGGVHPHPYSWAKLTSAMHFRSVGAAADASGHVHVFGVSGQNRLYHWQPHAASPTGFYDATPIATEVAAMEIAADNKGDLDAFTIGTAQSTLLHHYQEAESLNWVSQRVEIPQGTAVETYISYTSHVEVCSAGGLPLANAPVTITASEITRVSVNGHRYFTGPGHPIHTSTNAAGILSISRETGALAIPVLGINVTGLMPPDQTWIIDQSKVVQVRLASITGTHLKTAKDADGAPLLAEKYRTETTTDSVAAALCECVALANRSQSQVRQLRGTRHSNLGVGLLQTGELRDLRRLPAQAADLRPWRLSFEGDQASFEYLSPADALALTYERRASVQSLAGLLDWLDDVGDFFEGVKKKVITVKEYIVTSVTAGVKALITCTIDGVDYLFEAIVDAIETAFDIAETVLARVEVHFERIFSWLGVLFKWEDILRTREAVAHLALEFLTFLEGAATGAQSIIDAGFATARSQIGTLFDTAADQIGGSSIGGYEKANRREAPEFMRAVANNPFQSGLLDNAAGATPVTVHASAPLDDATVDPLMQAMNAFADSAAHSEAFTEAKQQLTTLAEGGPDAILGQLIGALLRTVQGVLEAVLAGAQAVIDALLGALRALIPALRSALQARWNIPLVTDLYRHVTSSELTLLDLLALTVAVPATLAYKALHHNAAPFPNAASVTAFKSTFTAHAMLTGAGFATAPRSSADLDGHGLGVVPNEMQAFLLVIAGVTTFFGGAVSAVGDLTPAVEQLEVYDKGYEVAKLASLTSLALQVTTMAALCPWWYSSERPGCSTAAGRQASLWIYMLLGVGIDVVWAVRQGRIAKWSDDIGVVIRFIYGLGHLVATAILSNGQSGLTKAANYLVVFPEILVWLRHTFASRVSSTRSLWLLAGADILFGIALAGVTVFAAPPARAPQPA